MIYFLPFAMIPVLLILAQLRARKPPPSDRSDPLDRSIIQRVTGRTPPAHITAPEPGSDYTTDEQTRQRMFQQSADTIGGRVAQWR